MGSGTESGVGDDHSNAREETSWEGTEDIEGCLVQEGGELSLVRCVEEEMAEAVICVHDLYLVEVVVGLQ